MLLRPMRGFLFSLLLGFHNAWESDDRALEDLGVRIIAPIPDLARHPLAHPERCFFWNGSSLLN